MTPTLAAAQDPWTPYEEHPNKGKGKGAPVVPEPAMAGAVLVGLCVLFFIWRIFASRTQSHD